MLGERLDLESCAPRFQNIRRRAMVKSTVDFTAAPHTAAFNVGDFVLAQGDNLAAITIFVNHFFEGKRRAAFKGKERPFFDKQQKSTYTVVLDRYGENITVTPPAGG